MTAAPACSGGEVAAGGQLGELTGGTPGLPDGAGVLAISGGGNSAAQCMATVIGVDHVLTAAHCFHDREPDASVTLSFAGTPYAGFDPGDPGVFLHPGARSGGGASTTWDRSFSLCSVNPAHDLAVVRLPGVGLAHPVRRLFHFCPFVLEPERCVGAKFSATAPSSEGHLGTWDYRADEARWTALGYFPAARGYPSSEVSPGANLAGVFWSHGNSSAGALEHGLISVAGEPCKLVGVGGPDRACTIADHYGYRVLSDPATPVERIGPRSSPLDLDLGAPPGFPARFPGESDGGPRPLLTLERDTLRAVAWLERGERAVVTDTLSATLRAALAAPELTWIPPSEPLSAAQTPRAPLAVGLRRADGALAELIVTGAGGGLALPSDDTSHGDALFAAPPERRAASEAGARAGYGAVYSRLFELVAVFGGVQDGAPADELTVTTAAEIRSVPLWGKAAPRRVVAATFAGRDRRLWAIDKRPRLHGPPRRYLVRIDPTTGRVETRRRLPALEPFERVWLRATPEGDALLVVSGHLGHATFVLRAGRFELDARVEVRGFQLGLGRLETLPLVSRRRVSAGVRVVTRDDDRLESRVIADLDHLQGGACDLARDLR